jgi:hypothetical protein
MRVEMDTAATKIAIQVTASAINLVFLTKTSDAVRFPPVLAILYLAVILKRKGDFGQFGSSSGSVIATM